MKKLVNISIEKARGAGRGARGENRTFDSAGALVRTDLRAAGAELDVLAVEFNASPSPRPAPSGRGGMAVRLPAVAAGQDPGLHGSGFYKCGERQFAATGGAWAFSLVEILLVTALLSLIMLALMSVFNSTQSAFRSSITQTDVLEGSRATMDLMTSDFRQMVASGGYMATLPYPTYEPSSTPANYNPPSAPINFWLSHPFPTVQQSLIGTDPSTNRINQVQSVFILTKQADVWHGFGYFVDTNSASHIYPLYRYDSALSIALNNLPGRPTPYQIFTNFSSVVATIPNLDSATNASHLLDGVLHFNVRAFDINGVCLTNGYPLGQSFNGTNVYFYSPIGGEVPMFMCSNTLPAAVEIQMGVLEDRILQRASSMAQGTPVEINYLSQQAGKVHLFRQRVNIPNVDPFAYQQ